MKLILGLSAYLCAAMQLSLGITDHFQVKKQLSALPLLHLISYEFSCDQVQLWIKWYLLSLRCSSSIFPLCHSCKTFLSYGWASSTLWTNSSTLTTLTSWWVSFPDHSNPIPMSHSQWFSLIPRLTSWWVELLLLNVILQWNNLPPGIDFVVSHSAF